MKSTITFICLCLFSLSSFSQLNMTLRGQVEYTATLNDIWGYADGQGNEYAIVGKQNGVSIVNVSNPDNPTEVADLPGINSTWRDMKTWGTNAYVTNETGDGVMVIDLSLLPDTATAYNWMPNIPGLGTINDCHNIFIDEFGFAYLAGCNVNGGGLLYLNVDTQDGTPEFIGGGPSIYSHDVYVRDNIAYSSEINQGVFTIYDVTNKSNTLTLGSQATAANTTHNAWLSDDSQYLFTTDETGNAPIGSYDISDPSNIIELDLFRPSATLNEGVVPHNVHVWKDWIIISYYSDGCIVVDGSEPDNLIEVGNFDTWISPGTGFSGAWGAYPFLPSETVLVTDQENGLYVLTPVYVRAARIEGRVFNDLNNEDLSNAKVTIENTNTVENTNISGNYKTGYHTGGTYNFTFSKPGFNSKTIEVDLVNDEIITLDVGLVPLQSFSFSANVVDEDTGEPIPNAEVKISNADFEFINTADANGNVTLNAVFEGSYEVAVGKWGYKTTIVDDQEYSSGNNSANFEIAKGYEDIFSLDLGWDISGSAATGIWELAVPDGLYVPQAGVFITPPEDDIDLGRGAYVTDNGLDIFSDAVSGGATILTSPVFDMEGTGEPMVSFASWFFSINPNNGDGGNDRLTAELSNGDTSATIAIFTMSELAEPTWKPTEISIKEFMEPTANMQLTITIANSNGDVTEGGLDNFRAWDAMPPSSVATIENQIEITAKPNPTHESFDINVDLNGFNQATLSTYSILGQPIESIAITPGSQSLTIGKDYRAGIYMAQIVIDDEIVRTIKLIKQ